MDVVQGATQVGWCDVVHELERDVLGVDYLPDVSQQLACAIFLISSVVDAGSLI